MVRCVQSRSALSVLVAVLVAALFVCPVSPASAFVIYDTLTQTANGYASFYDSRPAAQGFNVVSIPPAAALTSVILALGDSTGTGTVGVYIYDDNSGVPGSPIATLVGDTGPNAAGQYTYNPIAPVPLASDTTYYVVAAVSGGTGTYSWTLTGESPAVGSGTPGNYNGVHWIMGGYAGRTQVNAEVVPEPGSVGLMLAGLGLLGVWMRRRRRTV